MVSLGRAPAAPAAPAAAAAAPAAPAAAATAGGKIFVWIFFIMMIRHHGWVRS